MTFHRHCSGCLGYTYEQNNSCLPAACAMIKNVSSMLLYSVNGELQVKLTKDRLIGEKTQLY